MTIDFSTSSIITTNAGGWFKNGTNPYTSSGHYTKNVQCTDCHNIHGADYPRLANKGEDDTTNNLMCLTCHKTGNTVGAQVVDADLKKGADSTYRHPTLDISGKHNDTETFPWTTANRHAECTDCHDPHSSNATAASDGNASGKLANVMGVTPSYASATTVFSAPASTDYTTAAVTKEYQLCLKCHSAFNGNFPAPPGGAIAETDLAREFNPNNPSFHDVGIYTGAARSYAASFTTGSGMTGTTVLYCTSCHGPETSATALTATSSPAHGSANQYILKGVWNSTTTYSTTNNICTKCHDMNSTTSRFTTGSNNLHNARSEHRIACVGCHSEVPHGGKRPSLITIMSTSSITTAQYKYDATYDGVYGKNSKLYLKAWKSGVTRWNQSDCGCNGSGH
jgi:predicted CXXCH cytochrome family protein